MANPNRVKPVYVSDIVDALECLPETWSAYLNRSSAKVVSLPDDAFLDVEESEEGDEEYYGEADQELIALASEIMESDDYVELPSKFKVNDWSIMREFCDSVDNSEQRDRLLSAIHGNGAFRRFKQSVYDLGLEDEWFKFKDTCYEEIAIEWLDSEGILWTRTRNE